MCFTTYKKPRRKRATKNIVCYKMVNPNLTPFVISDSPRYEIGKIYHALYENGKKIKDFEIIHTKRDGWLVEEWAVFEGIHSYKYKEDISNSFYSFEIIECIIPKGTSYLYNKDCDEYVSLKVKPIKIFKEEL